MRKHMNAHQQQIFYKFMKDHPDLAQGFVKKNKEAQDELWNKLKNELNLAGSPIKDITSWKKTWLDWKNNIRRKIAHNNKGLQKNDIKRKLPGNETEVQEPDGGIFNQCALNSMEEKIALVSGLYKTIDRINNTKSFGVKKVSVQQTITPPSQCASSQSSTSSFRAFSITSASSQPTTSNQSEVKRTDLKENEISVKRKRCENLEERLCENDKLENISAKIEILVKNNNVEQTILEKIVKKLNNIDTRLGNLEKKYDKIIEIEIKKLEIISQHKVHVENPETRTRSPSLEVQFQSFLPNNIAANHPEEKSHTSSENTEKQINLTIKEEFYSDSDFLGNSEDKNLIEVCNTEYIYDEDIANSAVCLEEINNADLE